MKVKRFEAPSMQEALEKVRQEFGSEALILSTREVKKSSRDLFGKFIEITAGLAPNNSLASRFSTNTQVPSFKQFKQKPKFSDKQTWTEEISTERTEFTELQEEIRLLREELKVMGMSRSQHTRDEYTHFPLSMPETIANLYRLLRDNGTSDRTTVKVVNIFQKLLKRDGSKMPDMEMLLPTLCGEIPVSGSIELGNKPKVVALVGPTGVGKTTTIAKLAANFNLSDRKKVALFTLDTYRIAAVEQLKVYSKIMGVPLEVIETPNDLQAALKRHQDKELILLDSSGRSQKKREELEKLKKFFDFLEDIEIHLVLSATTGTETLHDVIRNFSFMSIDHLIFTKIDEALVFGNLLNVTSQHRIPVSYLTFGQDVPHDIESASSRKIAGLVLHPGQEI